MSNTLGLYLHVPFCLSKCAYCDFYSLPALDCRTAYVDALCAALHSGADQVQGQTVDTVFFGGGTPSLLSGEELGRIFSALESFSIAADCEISIEVNPATVQADTLSAYRALGINRISVGMQAASDGELVLLGRRHNAAQTRECVEAVRSAGFDNFSLDLMYGLPDQSDEAWENSLSVALSYEPSHLSLYALTLSESVPLYQARRRLPDEEAQRRFYLRAVERAEAAGLSQYEISNFARQNRACRHNLRYWHGDEYLGFGPSAASLYRGRRYTAPENVEQFLQEPVGLVSTLCALPPMDETERMQEKLLLSLRLTDGLDLASFLPKLSDEKRFLQEVGFMESHGLCTLEHQRLSLTPQGFFVSNEIISRLLLAAEL